MSVSEEASAKRRKRHKLYCYATLIKKVLPKECDTYDTSRMTIAFFALAGLKMLKTMEKEYGDLSEEEERTVERWIKSLYVKSEETGSAGFHGGTCFKAAGGEGFLGRESHRGHVAMTYTALASLRLIKGKRDFLEGLDREALAKGVRELQGEAGNVESSSEGGENDVRFVYCAAAVCHMLDDWSGMDRDKATSYILSCLNYDGGFGQAPNLESHGGDGFCAVAALKLMGRLDTALTPRQRARLVRYSVFRLTPGGFNGRPNKDDDTCYMFWVGATLAILEPFPDVGAFIAQATGFVLGTEGATGGLAKYEGVSSDPLHTYLGLGGLSLGGFQEPTLRPMDPALNVPVGSEEEEEDS